MDCLAVMAESDKKDLAWSFINFLNDLAHATSNAQFVHYTTPNLAAEKLRPAAYLADPVIYLSAEALSKSEFYETLPRRVER